MVDNQGKGIKTKGGEGRGSMMIRERAGNRAFAHVGVACFLARVIMVGRRFESELATELSHMSGSRASWHRSSYPEGERREERESTMIRERPAI
jgi:hypothetical protein